MKRINFPEFLDAFLSSYDDFRKEWDKAKTISIGDLHYSALELDRAVDFIVGRYGVKLDSFSAAVLSEIAENTQSKEATLKKIWNLMHKPACISIALRSDISAEFLKCLLETNDEDILSHIVFNPLLSVDDCLTIKRRDISSTVNKAVERAIAAKS